MVSGFFTSPCDQLLIISGDASPIFIEQTHYVPKHYLLVLHIKIRVVAREIPEIRVGSVVIEIRIVIEIVGSLFGH